LPIPSIAIGAFQQHNQVGLHLADANKDIALLRHEGRNQILELRSVIIRFRKQ
jgi:hypothetical protein